MKSRFELGAWITIAHPSIVEIVADRNFDWVCIDLEHSPTDRLNLQTCVGLIQGKGKKAFVRVPQNTHLEMKYPLDSGVDGIIVPMVNSANDAKNAVENAYYPPRGKRGVGLARAHKYGMDFASHLKANLENLRLFVQIEHYKGVLEIDEILTQDSIEGVFLGPYDLSGSMNIPGQFDHPKMLEAIATVSNKTLAAGKKLGAHVIAPNAGEVKNFIDKGYNFIAFSLDSLFLGNKIADELNNLKNLLEK